jgi:hypothetical protein
VTFSANVSGGSALLAPVYNWTVNAGHIIEGQGTPTIRVDTAGIGGQTLTASLDVRAAGLSCPASCAVSVPVPKLECRKFDEFPRIPRNDEKARLDNFAIDLQNTPGSTAYVILYPSREARQGETEQHSNRIVDYLVSYRGIDASRIIKLMGPIGPALRLRAPNRTKLRLTIPSTSTLLPATTFSPRSSNKPTKRQPFWLPFPKRSLCTVMALINGPFARC